MTAQRYYVKRPNGKVFGPFDPNAIRMMIKGNKLDANAQLSEDKISWRPIGALPEFSDLGQDLPMSSAGMDLPRPAGPGMDLPRPAGPGMDLPRSAGPGMDLPRPAGPGMDLPRPAGPGMDLPRPAGGGFDLPRPAGPADLPRSAAGPIPPPSRPSPPPNPNPFGAPASDDDLFGGPMSAQGPSDDDLFGAPMGGGGPSNDDDLFGAPSAASDDDDLFGAPMGGGPSNDDDLFGAPSSPMGNQESDLFGGPVGPPPPAMSAHHDDDDLFGAPSEADDDLFGAPQVGGEASEADLFGDTGGDDDFLGGDQGFSFLDENPAPLNAPGPSQPLLGNQDSWGDDLLGGQASEGNWEDELLSNGPSGHAQQQPPPERIDLSAMEPERPAYNPMGAPAPDDGNPFMPASTGLPEHLQKQLSSGAEQPPPKVEKQATGEQRSKLPIPVLVVGGLILLGAIGFGVYQAFFAGDGEVEKVVKKEIKFEVDLNKLKSARHAELRDLYTKSKKATASGDEQAKLLLAEALFLSRYSDPEIEKDAQKNSSKVKGNSGISAVAKNALLVTTGEYDAARDALDPLSGPTEVGFYAQLFSGIADVKELEAMAAKGEVEKSGDTKEKKEDEAKKEEAKETPPAEEGAEKETEGAEGAEGEEGTEEPAEPAEPEKSKTQKLVEHATTSLGGAAKADATMPMYWMGRLHEAKGDAKGALEAYKASQASSDSFIPTLVSLGRVYYHQGDLNEAAALFDKVNNELGALASNSERGEALHYMGMVNSARSESALAIESFTKALSVDSSRTDTLRALAEEYERAQKYKEALNFFKTNDSLGQKDPDVMLGIVRAHIGLKEWTKAMAQLQAGEKAFPTDARFPFFLGQLNMKRGTFFEAQKALERSVEIDPSQLIAHASLAQLAWRTEKDVPRGEEHILKIVEQSDKISAQVATEVAEFYRMASDGATASQWYRAAIEKDPNYWPARLSLSKLLLQQDETDRALKLLERSRKEGVKDIRLSAYLADAYRQSELYDKAIDEIGRVIEKFPKTPEYIFIRGRIYFDRGSYDNAMSDFNKAYELNPSYHEAYFYVGRTWFAKDDSATALKMFRHVLDYQPNNGKFRFYMGVTLESESRLQQALEEYRKVTEVDPAYALRTPEVYIKRGRLLSKLGYSRDGKKDLQKALELAPTDPQALIAMGEADFRDQEYEVAISNFSKALNTSPKHPTAQYQLGMSYIYQKQNRDGARHLQLAVKYGYDDPEVYQTLGYLYKDLGRGAEARKAFETFLKETKGKGKKLPRNTEREILRQIQQLGG